jgi:hypothetical protein
MNKKSQMQLIMNQQRSPYSINLIFNKSHDKIVAISNKIQIPTSFKNNSKWKCRKIQ